MASTGQEGQNQQEIQVLVEPGVAEATKLAAELFGVIVCETIEQRDSCNVSLAGGTTPRALYHLLAENAADNLPWGKMGVFFGDERDVPPDHVESNYGMIQRTLLDHVPVDFNHIHPMLADAADMQTAAAEYEQTIRNIVPTGEGGLPSFDLVLLGMGGDGHTASLFPASDALNASDKLVTSCSVMVLGRKRMTMTFPLINAARTVMLLVTGSDKAEAIAALLSDSQDAKSRLPAANIHPQNGKLIIILDSAAARLTSLHA